MKLSNYLQKWRNRDPHSRMYLFGGRVRVSTAVLLIAFIALFWVYETYDVPAQPDSPATQVVPPGYVPDPDYTWVPRTNVQTRAPESDTETPTTSPTETTETTAPDDEDTTEPETPTSPTTTLIDPDGSGPLGPQTFTQAPPETSAPSADRTPATTPAEP